MKIYNLWQSVLKYTNKPTNRNKPSLLYQTVVTRNVFNIITIQHCQPLAVNYILHCKLYTHKKISFTTKISGTTVTDQTDEMQQTIILNIQSLSFVSRIQCSIASNLNKNLLHNIPSDELQMLPVVEGERHPADRLDAKHESAVDSCAIPTNQEWALQIVYSYCIYILWQYRVSDIVQLRKYISIILRIAYFIAMPNDYRGDTNTKSYILQTMARIALDCSCKTISNNIIVSKSDFKYR